MVVVLGGHTVVFIQRFAPDGNEMPGHPLALNALPSFCLVFIIDFFIPHNAALLLIPHFQLSVINFKSCVVVLEVCRVTTVVSVVLRLIHFSLQGVVGGRRRAIQSEQPLKLLTVPPRGWLLFKS